MDTKCAFSSPVHFKHLLVYSRFPGGLSRKIGVDRVFFGERAEIGFNFAVKGVADRFFAI